MMANILKSKVFRNQLLSLMSVLMFASMVSLLLFYVTTKSLRNEISTNSSLFVSQMQGNIDHSLTTIENLAQSLSLNSGIISGCSLTGGKYGPIAINNGNVRNLLYEQKSINTSIGEICTIYFDQNTIITSNYSYSDTLVDSISNRLFGMNYDDLLSFLAKTSYQGIFLTECFPDINRTIFAVSPIFDSFSYRPGGVILVSLNTTSLLNMNARLGMINDVYMIYSDFTDVLFSTDSTYNEVIRSNLSNEGLTQTINYGTNDYILSAISSSVSSLKYYILLDNSRFFGNFNQLIIKIILANIASFLVGIFISLFWAQKNYSPIRDIVSSLNTDSIKNEDEFQHIRTTISTLLARQEDNEKTLASNAELIVSHLLINLLSGNIENSERFRTVNQKYQLGITGNTFLICLISMPSLHNKNFNFSSEQTERLRLIVTAGVNKAFSPNIPISVIDNNHDLVLIFNLENENNQPLISAYDILSHFTKFTIEYSEALSTDLYFSMTREYTGISGISSAYEEASDLLTYAYMSGTTNIPVTAEYRHDCDNPDDQNCTHMDYLKAERNILNCIIMSHYAEAAVYLTNVYEKYVSGSAQDKYVQTHVLKTVQTYLSDISSIFPHDFMVNLNLRKGMNPSFSLNERYQITISNLKSMDSFIKDNQTIENQEAKKILDFINQNYNYSGLSRDVIADNLNLSISSISHIIKNNTGKTLTELINEKRISKACELLKTTSLPLQQVAEQSGYTNAWTFSHAFKNATGVSPGKFRDTL